jgi:monovalent cation/proton antiporter MnhG/PhaG subunit
MAEVALLAFAALSAALTAIGVLVAKDSYERLQFMGPTATLGVWTVAAAVLVREGLNEAGAKAVLIAVIISVMNAVLSHATARAVYTQQQEENSREPGDRGGD